MTRGQLLLVAAIAGLFALGAPLVLLVRAMHREERRNRLTQAPLSGLIVLCLISVGAWLWIALTHVEISAKIQRPMQGFLLVLAAIAVYLLWLAIPVGAATWLVFKLPDTATRGPLARWAIGGIGLAAAMLGVYCAFLTGGAIWDFVLLVRAVSGQPHGLAGPAIVITGVVSFLFVVVLGSVTGLLLLIAAWGLEPRRRWREWRGPASKRSELPPA